MSQLLLRLKNEAVREQQSAFGIRSDSVGRLRQPTHVETKQAQNFRQSSKMSHESNVYRASNAVNAVVPSQSSGLHIEADALRAPPGETVTVPATFSSGVKWQDFDAESYLAEDRLLPGEDAYVRNNFNQTASDLLKGYRDIVDSRYSGYVHSRVVDIGHSFVSSMLLTILFKYRYRRYFCIAIVSVRVSAIFFNAK
jgi:hypothetical protein